MFDFNFDKMIFVVPSERHSEKDLREVLLDHPEIRFVSFVGLDIAGNDTDERIPVERFLKDLTGMLKDGVSTDGSAVNLPMIAELNNGRVSMIPDTSVNWYLDYNYENIDLKTGLPVGTLRIPSFLMHNDKYEVGSRVILRDATEKFKEELLLLIKKYPYCLKDTCGEFKADDIEEIMITAATELEFWVRTPDDKADREQLYTSQELKEQYWKRTYGPVRTALEKSIEVLDYYGFEVEMGHKEVGGVKSKLTSSGNHDHIMEQLEIDWKYSNPMQASDNEKMAKYIIRDIFNHFGLNTTFNAKPNPGVAGSGEHTHIGVSARLKNGDIINLFHPSDSKKDYLSPIGYGSLMGILKNYEAINPFISSSIDSLSRLKPGFEAPVCTVTSLGNSADEASRNRTVLLGLIREPGKPLATRFELRSPNPKSNTYMVLSACYMAMLDGIKAALSEEKSSKDLEKSISKKYGEEDFYLETKREYRSEEEVFKYYSDEERIKLFGKAPSTVWENLKNFEAHPEKKKVISLDGIIDDLTIASYEKYIATQWATEFHSRVIPNYIEYVRSCKKLHNEDATKFDLENWMAVEKQKKLLAKDSKEEKSLLSRAREALVNEAFDEASDLEIRLEKEIEELRKLYSNYKRNLL